MAREEDKKDEVTTYLIKCYNEVINATPRKREKEIGNYAAALVAENRDILKARKELARKGLTEAELELFDRCTREGEKKPLRVVPNTGDESQEILLKAETSTDQIKEAFILEKIKVRYVERLSTTYFSQDGSEYEEWDSKKISALRSELERKYIRKSKRGNIPASYGPDKWKIAIDSIEHENRYDPVLEYFNGCKKSPGKKDIALDNWLFKMGMIEEETDLTRYASKLFWVGMVARTFYPGCLCRYYPVLVGERGIGKSALVREMLPPSLVDFTNDNLDLSQTLVEIIYAVKGKGPVEIPEAKGVLGGDASALKHFTASPKFDQRFKYGGRDGKSDRFPYTHYMIGTVNTGRRFLPDDDAASARFVPLNCSEEGVDVEKWMEENREHLIALAVEYVKKKWKKDKHAASIQMLSRMPDYLREEHEEAIGCYRYDRNPMLTEEIGEFLEKVERGEYNDSHPWRYKFLREKIDPDLKASRRSNEFVAALMRAKFETAGKKPSLYFAPAETREITGLLSPEEYRKQKG